MIYGIAHFFIARIYQEPVKETAKKQEQTKREAGKNCVKLFSLVLISRQVSSKERNSLQCDHCTHEERTPKESKSVDVSKFKHTIFCIFDFTPQNSKCIRKLCASSLAATKKCFCTHTHTLTHTQQWRQKKKNSS